MIEVTEAIRNAMELFTTVYLEPHASQEIVDLQVEEAELSSDKTAWMITLGFSRQGEMNPTTVGEALTQIHPRLRRRYKAFCIDAETGQVLSMKVRRPEPS